MAVCFPITAEWMDVLVLHLMLQWKWLMSRSLPLLEGYLLTMEDEGGAWIWVSQMQRGKNAYGWHVVWGHWPTDAAPWCPGSSPDVVVRARESNQVLSYSVVSPKICTCSISAWVLTPWSCLMCAETDHTKQRRVSASRQKWQWLMKLLFPDWGLPPPSCACLLLVLVAASPTSLPCAYSSFVCETQNLIAGGVGGYRGHVVFPVKGEVKRRAMVDMCSCPTCRSMIPLLTWFGVVCPL